MNFFDNYNLFNISIIEFDLDDIVRLDICVNMVRMFYEVGY